MIPLLLRPVRADGGAPPIGAQANPSAPPVVTMPGVPGAYADPTRTGRTSPSAKKREETEITIRAAQLERVGDQRFEAEGQVVVMFDEVELRGQSLRADLAAGTAAMPGKVRVVLKDQHATIVGEDLDFDMDNRTWKFARGDGKFEPDFFPPNSVLQPVQARGDNLRGSEDRVLGARSRLTTCDYPAPHYAMTARELIIIPNQRAILKRVRLYYKDQVLAALPYYTIDLRPTATARRRQPLIPIFGQNDFEGKFLKLSMTTWAGLNMAGTGYLDLIEKRGTGFGLQNDYNFTNREGSVYGYFLSDKTTGSTQLDTRLRHSERFSKAITGRFSVDSTTNNQFQSLGSQAMNFDANLTRVIGTANSSLRMRREQFVSTFSTSTNMNAAFQHRQELGRYRSLSLGTDYRSAKGNSGFSLNELNTRAEFVNREKLLDVILRSELREDLDRGTNQGNTFVNALDRAPEITLRTDSGKLNRRLLGKVPMDGALSLGEFREFPENRSHQRIHLDWNAQETTFRLHEKLDLDLGAGFHQSFYSNSFARYIWNSHARFNARPARGMSVLIDYAKQKPIGFTPFRFDFANPYESLDGTLNCDLGKTRTPTTPSRPPASAPFGASAAQPYAPSYYGGQPLHADSGVKLRLNVSTGYDLLFNQYRDVLLRMQYLPSRSWYVSASSAFDANTARFRDLVTRLRLAPPRSRLRFNTAARYDPNSGRVTRVNTYASLPLMRWWQLEGLNGYNGFTRKSDFMQIRLRRELHDANVYMAYDRQRREFRLDFALKAFPAFDSRFGVGAQGQPLYGIGSGGELLGAGVGEIY